MSASFTPLHDATQETNNLQAENETLRKEIEETVEKLTCLRDLHSILGEVHDKVMEEQESLEIQNELQNAQIRELEREKIEQHKVFRRQEKLQCDQICELQKENAEQQRLLLLQAEQKDGHIRELQREILQYKKMISGSGSYTDQLSDTTIQNKMSALFHAVRDWAIDSVRRDDTLFTSLDKRTADWIHHQIPGIQERSSTWRANALIALVCKFLVSSFDKNWVFGAADRRLGSLVATANRLHSMIQARSAMSFEKKKQWVLLTNGLISKDDVAVQRSLDIYTYEMSRYIERRLGQGDHELRVSMLSRLRSIIRPHIQVIHALHHQEADYSMELFPAENEEGRFLFTSDLMEEVNGEEEGVLQASIFPIVYKHVVVEEKVHFVVICKARVIVES